jgi:hypothetical protein
LPNISVHSVKKSHSTGAVKMSAVMTALAFFSHLILGEKLFKVLFVHRCNQFQKKIDLIVLQSFGNFVSGL